MSLAEGSSARIAYKFYASGVMTSNALADSVSDLASSGGQILRRTASSLKLAKDTYQSAEIRSDKQIADLRHGVRRVTGSVSGEFSPATYWEFFEAALRATAVAGDTYDESDFTSVAADSALSTITFGSGDPTTVLRVGSVFRFTNMSGAGNNNKNFIALAFGGTNNRTVTVYPKPVTQSADTDFDMTTPGQSLIMPSTNLVSRKVAIEEYHSDVDIASLFTENRVGGFNLNLPPTGMGGVEFPMMGRNMEIYETTEAPFFASPTAETTTGIFAAVNGLLRVGGTIVGVVTGLSMGLNLSPSSDPVIGQNFVPEIFLGRGNMTGQITANFESASLIKNFINEDEIDILAFLTTSNADAAGASTIYLPRIKFTDADLPLQGEGGQTITLPFQALKYQGSAAGVPQTTVALYDTEAA